jgi:hypothetical protein
MIWCLDRLETATFGETTKMWKGKLRAKHLHHTSDITADSFLLCVELSGGYIDVDCDFVGTERLRCIAAWATNKD